MPSVLLAAACALPMTALGTGTTGRDAIVVTPGEEGLTGDPDAASQGFVEAEQLENRPLLRPAEVLEAIPGVIVTQHSGSGKANQYFLRGFNLDHGTDFAVHVDGMPVNLPSHGHGQGYADLNFLIPELVEHIHYRKGPYAAEDGDFSAAGAARVDLKRSLPGYAADITPGGFGYLRNLFSGNRGLGDGNLLGALEIARSNGPWVNPDRMRKLNGVLRYAAGNDTSGFTLTAMAYAARWNATDQIALRGVNSGLLPRFGAFDTSDGGQSSRYSLSAQWARSDLDSASRASAYLVRSRLDLFSNFTYFLKDPVNGDQFEQVDRRSFGGGEFSHSWRTPFEGSQIQHTAGLQLRHDDIGQVGLFNTAARARLGTVRSDAVRQTSSAAYYQASIPIGEKMHVLPGLRGDLYRFNVDSDNPANSGRARASLASPKLGFVAGPWSDVEYFVNYGHGFHSNDARGATISVDPATGAASERVKPLVRARGGELGVRAAPYRGLQTSLALWRLDLDSELVFAGDAGTTEASRASRRQGIEWVNAYRPNALFTADLNLTLSSSRFAGSDPAATGNHIPGAADKTLSGGLTYGAAEGWSGGVQLRYFGPRPLVEDNSQRSSASTIVNARLAYGVSRQLKLRLELLNAFDRKVDDITYFYTSRLPGEGAAGVDDKHFHPVEPRTLRLSAVVQF